jgi:hypothetical protein
MVIASFQPVGHEAHVVGHATVTEGVGFDLVFVTTFDAFHSHRRVIGVDDVQGTLTRTASAVLHVDHHVTNLQKMVIDVS